MAVSRMRSAFAPPKKGETFELRAGLVYGRSCNPLPDIDLIVLAAHSTPTKGGLTRCPGPREAMLTGLQERIDSEDYHGHDSRQGCVCTFSRCPQEYCNIRSGSKEACISLSHVGEDPYHRVPPADHHVIGIMPNHTLTSASLPSIPSSKTLKIQIH